MSVQPNFYFKLSSFKNLQNLLVIVSDSVNTPSECLISTFQTHQAFLRVNNSDKDVSHVAASVNIVCIEYSDRETVCTPTEYSVNV